MPLVWLQLSSQQTDGYSFSTDTAVAFATAKTLSPSFRFIRSTEPVVITDVTIPAAVRITTSDTTLSETIFSIVPGKRFRMLVLISLRLLFSTARRFGLSHHDLLVILDF